MDPPKDAINDGEWLEPDSTPWLNEIFSLPSGRDYDPITTRLLESAHGAEYIANRDIETFGTNFEEVLVAIIGAILSSGLDADETQKQLREWDIFREFESEDKTE